jgi:hypothetical protein
VGQELLQCPPGQPPKQRLMPSEVRPHTAFLPSQQSWLALAPKAPQMLPGGLQPVPLAQRPTGGLVLNRVQTTPVSKPVPAPPQQSWSLLQISPVRRQPLAGAQTVAPLPGSRHTREQQLVPPEHGWPSLWQPPEPPPETAWQVPGPPSLPLQIPEQQSVSARQMSPEALQT